MEIELPLSQHNVPYLDQYFGAWAMYDHHFLQTVESVRSLNLAAHLLQQQQTKAETSAAGESRGYLSSQNIGVIVIAGTMMKQSTSMTRSTSTVAARRGLRAASRDPEIDAIMLHIDSPGGTVAGTKELADEVVAARKSKPVYAYIEDLGASAAYWVASQAEKIFVNVNGHVGSIGTYAVIQDLSGMAAKDGIKVHVVRAGEFKGSGVPGTSITDAQLAEWQRQVDTLNEGFLSAVASGRGMDMPRVKSIADGRVHIGKAAVSLGLVDAVQTFEEALTELAGAAKKSSARGRATSQEKLMSEQNAGPAPERKPATIAELKAKFPKSSAEFREGCLEKSLTLAEATDQYLQQVESDRDKSQASIQSLQQENEKLKAAKPMPGVNPIGKQSQGSDPESSAEGDCVAQFDSLVRAEMKGGMDRFAAIATVARKNPQLHKNFLLATNPSRRSRTLIEDKFES